MMFMRWPGRGNEQQAVQLALFVYFLCNNQMAGMNGIKCTAIDTQPAGIHGCDQDGEGVRMLITACYPLCHSKAYSSAWECLGRR